MRVAVVINPVAGLGGASTRARHRAELAAARLVAAGAEPEILVTERAGHGRELARGAVERGARVVAAWGGDGTVNEVAAALVGSGAALGVIPAGSGNGLARTLNLPADPAAAIARLLGAAERLVDVGEMDGRLFVNLAGVGFDAHIAAAFAASPGRRGFLRYAAVVLTELRWYQCGRYALATEAAAGAVQVREVSERFLIAFANGRQWGNGAIIAPSARIDDGRLDVVAIAARSPWAVARAVPNLFAGTIDRVRGVDIRQAVSAVVEGAGRLDCHVDGEPFTSGARVAVRVVPGALRVRA